MKRSPSAKLPPDSSSPRRIAAKSLRDHGTPERVERIWGCLQQHIELAPPASVRPRTPSRWWLAAAGVAAGFALGLSASFVLVEQPAGDTAPVVMAPTEDDVATPQVFAAGTAARSYALPGGAQLQLGPESIVDTVRQDSGELTLRLVRGQATLLNTGATGRQLGARRLALRIGDARVEAIEGQLRVQLDGDTAKLLMLNGTAAVSSPHLNQGQRQTLRTHQRANIPTRVITAVVPLPSQPSELSDVAPSDPAASPTSATDEPPAPPAEWMKACSAFEYAKAAELLGAQGVGQASNAEHMMCIATGHQALQNGTIAMGLYQRVIAEHADSHYASQAAHHLANIHRASGNTAEQQRYEQLARRLSKGALLSEPALCQKIEQEAEAQNDDKVLALSKRYREQYPDGPCSDTVEKRLAEATKRKAAAEAKAAAAASQAAPGTEPPNGDSADSSAGSDEASGSDEAPYPDSADKGEAPGDSSATK